MNLHYAFYGPAKEKFCQSGFCSYLCSRKYNRIIMCTYNIVLNDTLVQKARPVFPDDSSLQRWLQEQVSAALEDLVGNQTETAQQDMVSSSLKQAFRELHAGETKKNARQLFA
ncbi:MAG: hypothetical protein J6I49_08730 [Bacteroidales bacterium]|nr:hypothetical protein [Bacteroidales bacterium]